MRSGLSDEGPRSGTPVTADELARARNVDAPADVVETGRSLELGPRGLSFHLSLDVRPMVRFARALALALARAVAANTPPPVGCRK